MIKKIVSYLSRHQLHNPSEIEIGIYEAISGFAKKVPLPNVTTELPIVRTPKNILIGMYRANVTSNFLDLYLYVALKTQGHNVKVVLCDGSCFPCDNVTGISNLLNYRCMQCKSTQNIFAQFIDENDFLYVKKNVTGTNGNLTENAIASAKRFDMSENYDHELAARFQNTYNSIVELLKNQKNVDLMIMSHGLYATWGAFRDYCVANKIDYITWGRTYFEKMIGVVKNAAFNEGPAAYDSVVKVRVVHSEEYVSLLNSLKSRVQNGPPENDTVNYYGYLSASETNEAESKLLSEAKGRNIVSIYLSIPWDGTVYGSNGEFRSQKDLINHVVYIAKKFSNYYFVFRVHPREIEMPEKAASHITEAMNGFSFENIKILEPQSDLTSYKLAKISALNILYSGTLAIEFAYAGYPLVVCGKNLVNGIESVTVIKLKSELEEIIELGQFKSHTPNSESVLKGINEISKVLYHDDFTHNNNYEVLGFKTCSKLIERIITELV
jgi:hypothetical protein